MAVIQSGASTSLLTVDPTFLAARVNSRPLEYGTLGHYKMSVITGSMAAGLGADSEILQFRWTDATRFAVITQVELDGMYATTAFVAGGIRIYATIARSFTAAGTGGNTATITGNNNKMRTSMGTTIVGEIRSSSTAALGAGTKTLDSQPIGQINTHSAQFGIATPVIGWVGPACGPGMTLVNPSPADGEHPIILATNEGVVVRATVPGTGVWIMGMTIRWAEVAAY